MKLWQKVFLLSLLFMITATQITAYLILRKNFNMVMEREYLAAVFEHNSYSSNISGGVMFERLKKGKVILSKNELFSFLKDLSPQDGTVGMALYNGDEKVNSYNSEMLNSETAFRYTAQRGENCLTLVFDYENKTYIAVGSVIRLEEQVFSLFTVRDVSILYANYNEQLKYVQLIGIISACVLGSVLLVTVLALLAPLLGINKTIKEITGGNYSLRLKPKGGKEFKELSVNINVMANAVEENITRLESIADGRKQFIDNLAHEMKTPLTSILGFADILRVKRVITERERMEYSGIIIEETKRLKGLSGKLLELASASDLELDLERVKVPELFDDVYKTTFPVLYHRRIQLVCTINEDIVIMVDKELFKSLIYNLIDNAAKASQDGQKIYLECTALDSAAVISVSDRGMGMSEKDVKKATEPFYMADKSRSRKAGGVGLGLALCMEIAKKHSAELKIKSVPGKGTVVSITMRAGSKRYENN